MWWTYKIRALLFGFLVAILEFYIFMTHSKDKVKYQPFGNDCEKEKLESTREGLQYSLASWEITDSSSDSSLSSVDN